MTYYDRIRELTKNVPVELVDFEQPRDWQEHQHKHLQTLLQIKNKVIGLKTLITRAINENSKNFVAVKYGKSDDLVAGEDGFDTFYQDFQTELDTIGKRPDLLDF
jgi:hypothetical protein